MTTTSDVRMKARSTRSALSPTPLRSLVPKTVEAIQDEIEPELERMLVALRELPDVLLRVLVKIRVVSDRDSLEDGLGEIRYRALRDRGHDASFPERRSHHVAIQDVIRVVRHAR